MTNQSDSPKGRAPAQAPERSDAKSKGAPPTPIPGSPATPGVKAPGAKAPGAKDTLKTMMSAGESGSRNPTETRTASDSGGTSGAEDTTRTAGYVADLATPSEAPPGPPVAKDPAMITRPEKAPAPAPKDARPSPASAAGKKASPSETPLNRR